MILVPTLFAAGTCGLIFLVLSYRVVQMRTSGHVSLGGGVRTALWIAAFALPGARLLHACGMVHKVPGKRRILGAALTFILLGALSLGAAAGGKWAALAQPPH